MAHTRSALWFMGAVLGILVSPASIARGRQEACRPPDATSTALLRELAKVPDFHSTEIALVQDHSLCRRAGAAYRLQLPANPRGLSGRVHLVRVGDRFAVLDPGYYGSRPGVWTIVLLDSRLRAIGVLPR
jgi:hypothetical protein